MVIVTTLARDTQEHIKNIWKTSLVLHYSRTVRGVDTRDTRELAPSWICVLFWIPQKSLLKSSYPKRVLAKIFALEIQNFKSKKILPAALSLRIQSTRPPLPWFAGLNWIITFDLFVLFRNFFFNMAHNMRLNSARFPALDSFTEIKVFLEQDGHDYSSLPAISLNLVLCAWHLR